MAGVRLCSKALFVVALLCVNEVIVCARRVSETQTLSNEKEFIEGQPKKKTADLDWRGDGHLLTGCVKRFGCSKEPGCGSHYIWLDTPRQRCRYTDEYKLQRDQMGRFFPVELARLHEKSEIFAKSGCIVGGWWNKCHRRMTQITRLFNYLRKARAVVDKEGKSHPAYGVASCDETQQKFEAIAENMAAGFEKNQATSDMGMMAGMEKLMSIPGDVDATKKAYGEAGITLTEVEVGALQQSKQMAAYLNMMGGNITSKQEDILRAQIELKGVESSDSTGPDVLDEMVADQEDLLSMMDETDRAELAEMEEDAVNEIDDAHDGVGKPSPEAVIPVDGDESDDHGAEQVMTEDLDGTSSLMQLSSNAGDGPLQMLVKGLRGGMKWLVKNGLGWILRRIAWTVAFMVGFLFNAARAFVLFPISAAVCTVGKFTGWFLKDLMWSGKNIKKGFVSIGKCPAQAWEFVGFDKKEEPEDALINAIIYKPARRASWFSGVNHLWKSGKPADPCRAVKCGVDAICQNAKCLCRAGLTPAADKRSCVLSLTENGCECKQFWKDGVLGTSALADRTSYGCDSTKCMVDQGQPSFKSKSCREALAKKEEGAAALPAALLRLGKNALGVDQAYFDKCTPADWPGEVSPVEVNEKLLEKLMK